MTMKMMMVMTMMCRVFIFKQCIGNTNCKGLNIQGSLQVCGLQRASEQFQCCVISEYSQNILNVFYDASPGRF